MTELRLFFNWESVCNVKCINWIRDVLKFLKSIIKNTSNLLIFNFPLWKFITSFQKKGMHAWIRVTLKCTSITDVHFSATPWILFQNGAVIIVIVAHLHIRFYLIIPNHLCDCLHTHHSIHYSLQNRGTLWEENIFKI